ncbi:aldo/keto reductase [Sphingomonas sp. AOB5]|uniref:aldo/keto reductase n=1 Tax=Sphingomonas sp. AOB5 TaxID=3034017 RepID=UPI0023F7A8A9|nr:aldo/keto reductase [Sphingomonas sp. AOB5]MDF7776448.1 aldo/keto reductase [Sphingomonas sp. AOB5]
MNYRQLGRSGLKVPPLCLGTATFGAAGNSSWRTGQKQATALVRAAMDRGIFFLDTGSTYGGGESEAVLGHAIRDLPRRDLVLTSKVFFPTNPSPNARGLSRKNILASIDASLAKLGTDHLDIYMIHRWDPETPIEETLAALEVIVTSGRARYLGASSMSAWRLMKALGLQRSGGLSLFICMQNYYNLLYREEEREMQALCVEEGVGMLPWSPLARGLLAGVAANADRLREDRLVTERFDDALDRPVIDALEQVAAARGVPPAQVALAWLMSRPGVIAPVLGITDVAQLDDAIAATGLVLDEAEIAALEAPYRPHPVIGF